MRNSKPKVAIVVTQESIRTEFAKRTSAFEVEISTYESITDFRNRCGEDLYSGLIVDLRTTMKATGDEKSFFGSLELSFPTLRVNYHPDTGQISGVAENLHLEGEQVFEGFIKQKCLPFRPRGVRIQHRHLIHLNLELLLPGQPTIRSNTMNVSAAGVFILSVAPFKMGQIVHFTIREFKDPTPIETEVRWILPWGTGIHELPGIGVMFRKVSESQRTEVDNLVNPQMLRIFSADQT